MSRPIKFRVWNKNTNKYEYTELDYYFVIDQRIKEYEYEQYTGLKDENGKEIYEGDIVTLSGEWEEIEEDDCQVITFKDGCFRVGDGYENEAGIYLSNWRIIGNIHENPELLNPCNSTELEPLGGEE